MADDLPETLGELSEFHVQLYDAATMRKNLAALGAPLTEWFIEDLSDGPVLLDYVIDAVRLYCDRHFDAKRINEVYLAVVPENVQRTIAAVFERRAQLVAEFNMNFDPFKKRK